MARAVRRSLCLSGLSPLALWVSRSASHSVCGVGLGPTSGVEWGCAPLLGGAPRARSAARRQPQTPQTQPSIACAHPTPFVGRGAMGSHLRVVRPGEPSRLRRRLGRFRCREGSQGAPRQAPGCRAVPSGSARQPGGLAPSHRYPAVAGAQAFGETPLKRHDPSHTAAAHCLGPRRGGTRQCASAVWVWVSDDLKGFSRGNMA